MMADWRRCDQSEERGVAGLPRCIDGSKTSKATDYCAASIFEHFFTAAAPIGIKGVLEETCVLKVDNNNWLATRLLQSSHLWQMMWGKG